MRSRASPCYLTKMLELEKAVGALCECDITYCSNRVQSLLCTGPEPCFHNGSVQVPEYLGESSSTYLTKHQSSPKSSAQIFLPETWYSKYEERMECRDRLDQPTICSLAYTRCTEEEFSMHILSECSHEKQVRQALIFYGRKVAGTVSLQLWTHMARAT